MDGLVPHREAGGVPRGRLGRLGYHRRQEGEVGLTMQPVQEIVRTPDPLILRRGSLRPT